MTKKSRQKFKYLENKNSFLDEIKNIFIIFKELSLKQIKQCFWKGRDRLQFKYPDETKLLRAVKQFNKETVDFCL